MRAEISKALGNCRAAITIELEAEDKVAATDLLSGLLALFGFAIEELALGRCPRCSCEGCCDCSPPCGLCALRAHAGRVRRG